MGRLSVVVSFATAAAMAGSIPAAAQISDDVVKIGVLSDMSSLYSDSTGTGSLIAAHMAAADFNYKVKGKAIEVVGADHQNKPDLGSSIAREWYDTGKVDVIVDVPTSSVALAVQRITRDKDRVLLMSGAAASDLTGPACSPNGIHWTYDTYALGKVAGQAMVARGEDTWFFITVDYVFGHALERDTASVVRASGGQVLGAVRAPINTQDFSSYLLQAQASKAKVIGLANTGGDMQNAIKQASEFGLQKGGQKLAALLFDVTDARSLGLQAAQNMIVTAGFYWDIERGDSRILPPLHAKGQAHADHVPGRRLFGGDALSQRDRCDRHRCGQDRSGQNEGYAGQRFLRQEWPDPRGRPYGA